MQFRNYNQLASHFSKNNNSLIAISSTQDFKSRMRKEGDRLRRYLQEEIQAYYDSYTPMYYERTYDWLNSVRVSDPYVEDGAMKVKIYFDDNLAYHPSVMGQEDGYIPWLYEVGFRTRLDSVKSIYRFTNYEGFHPVLKAMNRYNSDNPLGFKIIVQTGYGSFLE